MGVPMKRPDTAYARYISNGGRIVALRIPPEITPELEMRTRKRGLSITAYIKAALYWYMKEEAVKEQQLNRLETGDEQGSETVGK